MENTEPLRLLSDSLKSDLKELWATKRCEVAWALVRANDGDVEVTDYCTMVTVRSETGDQEDDLSAPEGAIAFSFLPKGKQAHFNINGKWARTNRQTSKVGKVALALLETKLHEKVTVEQVKFKNRYYCFDRHLTLFGNPSGYQLTLPSDPSVVKYMVTDEEFAELPQRSVTQPVRQFTDVQYEAFGNNLKSFYDCKIEFKIVEGDDIAKYYHDGTYYNKEGNRGTLWDSCMRAVGRKYFDIYKDNCQLLVAFNCDEVIGRALLWKVGDTYFMDRIYYYKEYIKTMFIDHAIANKWHYKYNQCAGEPHAVRVYSEEGYKTDEYYTININLKDGSDYDEYPYCDTFKYLNMKTDVISNNPSCVHTHILESTGGNADEVDEDDFVDCAISGDRLHIDDAAYISYNDEYVCHRYAIQLTNGDMARQEDAMTSTRTGRTFLVDEAVEMEDGSMEWEYEKPVKLGGLRTLREVLEEAEEINKDLQLLDAITSAKSSSDIDNLLF